MDGNPGNVAQKNQEVLLTKRISTSTKTGYFDVFRTLLVLGVCYEARLLEREEGGGRTVVAHGQL